jgi:hypothetical protein
MEGRRREERIGRGSIRKITAPIPVEANPSRLLDFRLLVRRPLYTDTVDQRRLVVGI